MDITERLEIMTKTFSFPCFYGWGNVFKYEKKYMQGFWMLYRNSMIFLDEDYEKSLKMLYDYSGIIP